IVLVNYKYVTKLLSTVVTVVLRLVI
ncbi:MAG: hypothetical protein QG610_109, partial [Euryarchaeota archaeon]|nr:hypothetical protein [Euryarchaeota archaeon]